MHERVMENNYLSLTITLILCYILVNKIWENTVIVIVVLQFKDIKDWNKKSSIFKAINRINSS